MRLIVSRECAWTDKCAKTAPLLFPLLPAVLTLSWGTCYSASHQDMLQHPDKLSFLLDTKSQKETCCAQGGVGSELWKNCRVWVSYLRQGNDTTAGRGQMVSLAQMFVQGAA